MRPGRPSASSSRSPSACCATSRPASGSPPADRAQARPVQPARPLHAGGPGPDRRPHVVAHPASARADHAPRRHRHRVDQRRREARPRRPAGRAGARAAGGAAPGQHGGRRARAGRGRRPGPPTRWSSSSSPAGSASRHSPAAASSSRRRLSVSARSSSSSRASGTTWTPRTTSRSAARRCRSPSSSRSVSSSRWSVMSALAVAGYLVTNWAFRVTRRPPGSGRGLAPQPRTVHHPRDHARRRPGRRGHRHRGDRGPGRPRGPAERDRHGSRPQRAGQLHPRATGAPRSVVESGRGRGARRRGTGQRRRSWPTGPPPYDAAGRGRSARPSLLSTYPVVAVATGAPVWFLATLVSLPVAAALAWDRSPLARPRPRRRSRRRPGRQPGPAAPRPGRRARHRLELPGHLVPAPGRPHHAGRDDRRWRAGRAGARHPRGPGGRPRRGCAAGPGQAVPRVIRMSRSRSA